MEDGRLRVFRYGFAEYRRRRALASSKQVKKGSEKPQPKGSSPKPKGDRYQQKKRQEALAVIEERIEELEAKLSEIEKLIVIASEEGDSERIAELGRRHKDVSREIEQQMQAWEKTTADGHEG